jgi:ATP-dependent protease Clp ATPase subunit
MIRDEVASSQTLTVSICPDCLNICRSILKKEIKTGAESVRHRVSSSRQDRVGPLCCSFCDTPQHIVNKLIGSPRGSAPAYICDKCVAAGVTTVEKDMRHVGSWKNLWHWITRRFGIHPSQIHQTS